MSMAEDTRYRPDHSHESYRSDRPDAAGREPSPDPLTELARLIGQNDPFGDPRGRRAGLHPDAQGDAGPAPGWLARADASAADDQAGHADNSYAERSYGTYRQQDDQQHDAPYDQYPPQGAYAHDDRYAEEPHSGDDRYRVALPAAEYEAEDYYDDGHLPPRGDDGALHGRRRGGLITVAAVLGLAVIGTAGAFGYRAYTGPSAESTPPVIKADPNPAKTTPAAPSADAQDKPFQDRIGAPGTVQTERIVPREEAPVQQPAPPAPRAGAPVPPPAAAVPTPGPADTKRVRTETIRLAPNGDTTATARPTAAPQTPPARAAKQNAPMAIAPPADVPAASTRTATRSAPPASDGGAYVVQVSAQKTEGEAQSSYRALQAKYPDVLGGREAAIRRADLGDKGVYYRAQIGGFASASAANTFCDSLKAAGGQCIVQKN
jgi:hypothetical protein